MIAIVGSGLAGLVAALTASEHPSAKIILLEANNYFGGNSMMATSGISAAGTTAQILASENDDTTTFESDTVVAGMFKADPMLVKTLVENSNSAIEYLKSYGIDLSVITTCGGHSKSRTHKIPNVAKTGNFIVNNLITKIMKTTNIELLLSARVTSIRVECDSSRRSKVTGLTYTQSLDGSDGQETVTLCVQALILCTGGAVNCSEIRSYAPEILSDLPTTSKPDQSRGEGIQLAKTIGAELLDLHKFQIHPTAFIDPNHPESMTKYLCPESFRALGGILISQSGKRFVNELSTRKVIATAILNSEDCEGFSVPLASGRDQSYAYLVINDQVLETFGKESASFYFNTGLIKYHPSGYIWCIDTMINPDILMETFNDWNSDRTKHSGLKYVKYNIDDVIYVAIITPALHYTLGGIKIDKDAAVIDNEGLHIQGLFAAGECCGGIHGDDRLAGNSLLDCIVFGRIAGRGAASIVSEL